MENMKTVKELFKPRARVVYAVLESSMPSRLEEMIVRVATKYAVQENLECVVLAIDSPSYKTKIVQEHLGRLTNNIQFISDSEILELTKSNITVCSECTKSRYSLSHNIIPVEGSNYITDAITEGNLDLFKSNSFSSLMENECKVLMNELRLTLGLIPISFDVKFATNELREQYFNKLIFNIGDIVESHEGEVYEIINRGSNYVMVVDSSGNTKRKWITDIVESVQSIPVNDQVFSFKGFIPKNISESDHLVEIFKSIIESHNDSYSILMTLKLVENYIEFNSLSDRLIESLQKFNLVIQEDQMSADYKTDKKGRKYRASRITFANSKDSEEDEKKSVREATVAKTDTSKTNNLASDIAGESDTKKLKKFHKVGSSLESNNDYLRKLKVRFTTEAKDEDDDVEPVELSDEELEKSVSDVDDWDDVIDAYDDDEFVFVDEDGKEVKSETNEEVINEVLSRMERIKARLRFEKTKAKRERAIQIALKRRSSTKVINSRARKLAISMLKKKIAKKSLDKLSITEKERLEKIIERSGPTLNRLAIRLAPKVRKIENDRLSHPKVTKDADKNDKNS